MSIFAWLSRRTGGIAMIALLALCYWVISQESDLQQLQQLQQHRPKVEQLRGRESNPPPTTTTRVGVWTFIFAYYCLLVHVMVFIVPLRACWGVWNLTQNLKRSVHSSALADFKKLAAGRRESSGSRRSSETLTSSTNYCSSTTSEAGDVDPEMYTEGAQSATANVTHAVIIPNYKEELDTLKETLEVLASHARARDSYDIYLGMEQREEAAESKALGLIQDFAKNFRSIDFTLHPEDIPGESAGKGSNVAWAARKFSAKYSKGVRKDVIITIIDADSHLSADYFSLVANMHLSYSETAATTIYSAPIIFDRNAHSVPALVRVADILWCAAGLSGLYRGSTISPPTSVYSLPLDLVDRVGGWDCDGEAIGEDLHMYLKCFFALNGNLTSRVVNSPVSQSNVTSGCGGGFRGISADIIARYKQALRHMWGALDTGFTLRKLVEMWRNRNHTSRAYRPLHSSYGEDSNLYIPDSQLNDTELDTAGDNGIFSDITKESISEPHWERVFYLVHRVFEAHFLPLHMTILVVASTLYMKITEANSEPNSVAGALAVCSWIRISGLVQVALYLFLYESFHRICVASREREMAKARLSTGMRFSRRRLRTNMLDYIMVPLVAPLYGAIPCAHALISHFWTLDLVYTVSKKATRQKVQTLRVEEMA